MCYSGLIKNKKGIKNMHKRLEEQLEIRKKWLEEYNYTKEEYLEYIKKITDLITELSIEELISVEELSKCQKLLTTYLIQSIKGV